MNEESIFCLRNHVNILQQELDDAKDEAETAKSQISCLLTLVKRSWYGDIAAQLHLSNIIGVPIEQSIFLKHKNVPETQNEPETKEAQEAPEAASDEVMSRASRSWLRLTAGLLSRQARVVDAELRRKQSSYLERRIAYLTDLMDSQIYGEERQEPVADGDSFLSLVDINFLKMYSANPYKYHRRTQSATTFRPRNQRRPKSAPKHAIHAQRPVTVGEHLHRCGHTPLPVYGYHGMGDTDEQSYDNPRRYEIDGLFSANTLGRQPNSARHSAVTTLRNRPRSAENVSSEMAGISVNQRPLAAETTFPVKHPVISSTAREKPTDELSATLPPPGCQRASSKGDNQRIFDFVNLTLRQKEDTLQLQQQLAKVPEITSEFRKYTNALQQKLRLHENGFV